MSLQAKSAFQAWDRDGKGYLTERDVASALRGRKGAQTAWADAKHQWPPQRVSYLFRRFGDQDGDGRIDQGGVVSEHGSHTLCCCFSRPEFRRGARHVQESIFLALWRAQQLGFDDELNAAWSSTESLRQKTNTRDRESLLPMALNVLDHDKMKEN
jgi:hypothetical protein